MKRLLTFLGVAALSIQGASALITVPKEFPSEKVNGNSATQKDQLSSLISRYENDVVLLANPPEAFSKQVKNTTPSPAATEKLKSLGSTDGTLSVNSLAAAVTALGRQTPAESPTIVASAIALLAGLPGGASPENCEIIARAAINAIPVDLAGAPTLISFIIGVSVKDLPPTVAIETLKSLRDFVINEVSGAEKQAILALAVDEALVDQGIMSSYTASPEFLVLADNFATDQLAETSFSGDQGTITQGAAFSPGGAGSVGGSGNTGNQPADNSENPPPAS